MDSKLGLTRVLNLQEVLRHVLDLAKVVKAQPELKQ